MPHYNVMGLAKAALEVVGAISRRRPRHQEHPRQRHFVGADQDAGRFRHRRLPLYLEVERIQHAVAAQCDVEDVGKTGVYFLSDMASGVTGEIHHVDAGYHVVGIKNPDAPDMAVDKGD